MKNPGVVLILIDLLLSTQTSLLSTLNINSDNLVVKSHLVNQLMNQENYWLKNIEFIQTLIYLMLQILQYLGHFKKDLKFRFKEFLTSSLPLWKLMIYIMILPQVILRMILLMIQYLMKLN